MANAFTSTDLLASLKRRGLIPSSASTFTTSDFFKIVDEELQTYIVPLLLSVKEEYFVTYKDIAIVAGTTEYDIPERAIAGKLRDLLGSSGDGYRSLARIEPELVESNSSPVGGIGAFYLRGNKIVLATTPSSGTLRAVYYERRNRVVATTAVGEITAIVGNNVTISSLPSTFTTSVTYDFVKGKPGFDTLGKDYSASVVGLTMTFSSTPPTDLAVGDFVCLAQETPIAQIPVELHPLLSERVTATVLHALGDAKAAAAYQVAADMEKRLLKLISPRTEGANRVIVNKYGVGQGRRNVWGY